MTDTTAVATTDLTKAELTLALSKEGLLYQIILQACENVVFTNDNLNEQREKLTGLRKLKTKLEAMENPHTKAWGDWNKSRKSLLDPAVNLLARKDAEFSKKAKENADAAAKVEAEKQRKAGILAEIDSFFINQSQAIAAAQNPEELVRIEKLIGSHKANSSRYAEFLPLMAAKAANLTDLIKTQKIALKELEWLKTAENAANEIGDDQAILDSREAQEEITAKISENRETVQEKAIHMAINSEVTEVEVIAPVAPKPRRTSWKYEAVDMKAAFKAGLTLIVVDEEKVGEILVQKRKDEIECTENGIRYYKHFDY